jgi:hypothetical protein
MTARFVRTAIEVPGTPDEVWDAIATGPGIASWFVPAEVDERAGGEDWGDEIDGTEAGWQLGMENLRLYLTHLAGLRCSHALAVGVAGEGAWPAFACALGVHGAGEGEPVDGRLVSGLVERTLDELVLRRDDAAALGAREETSWRAWMDEHLSAAV